MIEFISLILALFAWMAASLWLAAFFRIPIQVDRKGSLRSKHQTLNFDRGETSRAVMWNLEDLETDLTGATVYFSMARLDGSKVIERAKADVVRGAEGPILRYKWDVGDTSEPGVFEAEFEVALADQTVELHPKRESILLRIVTSPQRSPVFVNQAVGKPL